MPMWSLYCYILISFMSEGTLQATEREMWTPIQQQTFDLQYALPEKYAQAIKQRTLIQQYGISGKGLHPYNFQVCMILMESHTFDPSGWNSVFTMKVRFVCRRTKPSLKVKSD